MAVSQNKKTKNTDLSRFDNLETEALEAFLRADLEAPEEEQEDPEVIMYIVGILAEREGDDPEIDDAKIKASLADFWENYYPLLEQGVDLEEFFGWDEVPEILKEPEKAETDGKFWDFFTKGRKRFAVAAMIIVAFVFGGSVTAYGFGYRPFSDVRWNSETLWFERVPVTDELIMAVAEYDDTVKMVPRWLPDGYVYNNLEIYDNGSFVMIKADFSREMQDFSEEIVITYHYWTVVANSEFERNEGGFPSYVVNDIKHFVIDNMDGQSIVWENGSFEGTILGNFSLEEAEKMIRSIYQR